MRNIKLLLVGIVLGMLVFNGAIAGKTDKEELSSKDLQRLTKIIGEVKKYYYKSIDSDVLFKKAIKGMLSGLDPHSDYLDEEALKYLDMVAFGKFGGIGVEVSPDQGAIRVVSPIDDTPAYNAGIKAGDYIVQINNKFVSDMTVKDAVRMMRGPAGSKLKLTIMRKNRNKPLIFNLRREIIKIKTVKSRMLEPGYGYVRLAWFEESTEKDMVRAIKQMQSSTKGNVALKGLILDLRNNPGGLVESAIPIAGDFLDANLLKGNKLIMSFRGQGEEVQATANAGGDIIPNIPIVILINGASASASEIVAGALQDHKRAIIVGERSFGKGTMQKVIPLDNTSAIQLTAALFYTPKGRSIQAKGIEPDINVGSMQISRDDQSEQDMPRFDEAALADHIQNSESNDTSSVVKGGYKKQKQTQDKLERELVYQDYQLYEALNIVKAQGVMREKNE